MLKYSNIHFLKKIIGSLIAVKIIHFSLEKMKEFSLETVVKVYTNTSEMSEMDQELMGEAIFQLKTSYAPYSNFRVGAALRLSEGNIVSGSNQENASFSLCMCAERVAIYNAATNFPGKTMRTLAITARHLEIKVNKPVAPCGACRQVICEFESKQNYPIRILLKGDTEEIYELASGKSLLPLLFDSSFLLT
jgi:cytidine deaminase